MSSRRSTEKTAEACKDLVRGYMDLEGVAARRSIKKAMKEWLFDLRHTRSARIWERDMKRETAARQRAAAEEKRKEQAGKAWKAMKDEVSSRPARSPRKFLSKIMVGKRERP